jgi:catechol 2,3-dioxygenase-like lactoylglutathione lyase family enzyme
MERAFTNILASDVAATARFYEGLLGMRRLGDFGWFVLLGGGAGDRFELGILDRHHETVPAALAASPAGVILTFVVDDVHAVHDRARDMGVDVIEGPKDMFYGQTRLLLRDPSGAVVDVSSLTA